MPIVTKPFELGPGAQFFRSNMRTLYAPARSIIRISLRNVTVEPFDEVPLQVQVMRASRDSVDVTGPDGPVVHQESVIAPFDRQSLGSFFRSDFGCPSTTRVRVRSGGVLASKVSGFIRFDYDPPGVVKLQMEGSDTLSLNGDRSVEEIRDLIPAQPEQQVVGGVVVPPGFEPRILGTGRFRIKAKWHTDPLWALGVPNYQILRVSLHRPDGTVAAEESGFSQHVSDDTINDYPAYDDPAELDGLRQRINFGYTVRPEDIQNIDQNFSFWKVRVGYEPTFPPDYSGQMPPVVNFDIDSGSDPTFLFGGRFESTFQAGCF